MLFNGDGGQAKDWVRAYALLPRASGSGLSQASETLAKMDEYIPKDQRQKGLELARQYQAQSTSPALPPEVLASGCGTQPPIRTWSLPPPNAPPPTHTPTTPQPPNSPHARHKSSH